MRTTIVILTLALAVGGTEAQSQPNRPADPLAESYASFPITLADGRFCGTLCATDPDPRAVSAPAIIAALSNMPGRQLPS